VRREDLKDSAWNALLRDHIPALLLAALRTLKAAHPHPEVPGPGPTQRPFPRYRQSTVRSL